MIPCVIKKPIKSTYILVVFSLFIIFGFSWLHTAHGAVQLFSKDEKPFGIPYDDWVSKYWNWDLSLSTDQFAAKPGGCIIDKLNPMVILMDSADVVSPPVQVCKISSNQGIMIPLWDGWCDKTEHPNYSDAQLTECAREEYNLGNILSKVSVDGVPIANLDVRLSLIGGSLNYKINSISNVTEIYSKGFNLTIPPNSHKADTVPGITRAGSQGWYVFLKPLPAGQHAISYNVRVTPTGALTSPGTNPHFADITYNFQVVK
jgi:hypothetical protein